MLKEVVEDFALGIEVADKEEPQAVNVRSKETYKRGIGPHSEAATIELVYNKLKNIYPEKYENKVHFNIPYDTNRRLKCDLCIGQFEEWQWNIEIKMLRFMGDNGKSNDNILMHILSPYPEHRSAFTDCGKLLGSGLQGKKAVLIFAYDYDVISSTPAIEAFEILANSRYIISDRVTCHFDDLIHPVHRCGHVYAWELIN